MDPPAPQQVLAPSGSITANRTSQEGSPPQAALPAALQSLISTPLSVSALTDWFSFLLIGGLIEMSRRFGMTVYSKVLDSVFIHAHFDESDISYGEPPRASFFAFFLSFSRLDSRLA